MKRLVLAAALTLILGISTLAQAETPYPGTLNLFDRGGGLIYDKDLNITWLKDANYAKTSVYDADGLMNVYVAAGWASGLVYGGYDDWRLPTRTSGEMGHLYDTELGNSAGGPLTNTGPFINLQPSAYWTGTSYGSWRWGTYYWYFDFGSGSESAILVGSELYAWAVRDGDVAPVPIPGAILLFAPGLAGIAALKRRIGRRG